MRFWLILLGLLIGAAGYFIGGTIGLGCYGVGGLFLLIGLFWKKKKLMLVQGPGNQTMIMSGNPNPPLTMRRV